MARNIQGFIELPPMKSKYTEADWSQREAEYIASINSLNIPADPTEVDILGFNAAIDSVYSVAKIEQATYSRLYDKMYQKRKNSETEVYLIVKKQLPADKKATEAELKSMGVTFLGSNPVDGTKYSIYQMVDMALDRKTFMDAVVDILKQKSDKLITDSGALKLSLQINRGQSA